MGYFKQKIAGINRVIIPDNKNTPQLANAVYKSNCLRQFERVAAYPSRI